MGGREHNRARAGPPDCLCSQHCGHLSWEEKPSLSPELLLVNHGTWVALGNLDPQLSRLEGGQKGNIGMSTEARARWQAERSAKNPRQVLCGSCVPWSLCQETESGTGPRWGQGLERQERHVGHTGVRMQQGELQRCPRQVRKAPELSRLFLKSKMPILRKGTELFSNYTREFSKTHTHTNEDAAEDPS